MESLYPGTKGVVCGKAPQMAPCLAARSSGFGADAICAMLLGFWAVLSVEQGDATCRDP